MEVTITSTSARSSGGGALSSAAASTYIGTTSSESPSSISAARATMWSSFDSMQPQRRGEASIPPKRPQRDDLAIPFCQASKRTSAAQDVLLVPSAERPKQVETYTPDLERTSTSPSFSRTRYAWAATR